jgi:hypothetical protein
MKLSGAPLSEPAERIVRCDFPKDLLEAIDSLILEEMRAALIDLGVRVAGERQREEDGD